MTKDRGGVTGDDEPTRDGTDTWRQVAQRHFDPDTDADLTTTLVYAIADARDIDPRDLKVVPLYEVVDAAAIQDTFFGPTHDGESGQGIGSVEFIYEDLLVSVDSHGWIQVYETNDADLT